MKKTILFLIFISISITWGSTSLGRGEIDGFLDYRYVWSKEVYAGSGTFQINNLNLLYSFPLNSSYKVFLQTNISPATNESQIIKQLYIDTATSIPLQMRLGRFSIETMERDKDQDSNCFISGPIFWDLNWRVAGNPLLPNIETGLELYNTGRNHDLRFYLLNGANEWVESSVESKKAVGLYFRTLLKNIVELRTSIYSNMYDSGDYDHTVFTGEARMEILDMYVKGGLLYAFGKNNGTNDTTYGGNLEIIMPINPGLDFAGFASIYKTHQYYYRGAIALKSVLNQDMIWKNEFCIEKADITSIRDYTVQSQIVVLL